MVDLPDEIKQAGGILAYAATLRTPEAQKRYRLDPGQCAYCDEHRDDHMMPSHTPSSRCGSGKHPHCTCDTCY